MDSAKQTAKIIIDKPASEDSFEGKGHKRLAVALADAISQLSDRDGAIGLEGNWGAGKSTVIQLASKELTKSKDKKYKYHIFEFDLWEHQSDDFRRSFLEEFVSWLEKDLITSKAAKKIRDSIRDRVKTVKSSNHKEYNFIGALLLTASPLIPLLYSWFSPNTLRVAPAERPELFGWSVMHVGLGVLACIYALYVLNVIYNYNSPPDPKEEKKLDWRSRFGRSVSRSLSLFSKDINQEELTQNIRESDPTTVEFHSIFRKLLSDVQAGEERVILVLDNIDRISLSQVPLIWSEVRSLFSNKAFLKDNPNSYVTAVVPYDKGFVQNAFIYKDGDKIESDVISKTFNIVLRVSPPILTGWGDFLKQQLNIAFTPDLNDQTHFKLFNILKYHFQKNSELATPRRVIAFINEIIAIWWQWGDVIKIEVIALYVLHRNDIEQSPVALQKLETIDATFLNYAGIKTWQKDFAALFFNVNPEMAYQVLLKQPLIESLSKLNEEQLTVLKNSTGFKEVFIDALREAVAYANVDQNLLSTIAKNVEFLTLDHAIGRLAWSILAGSVLKSLDKVDLRLLLKQEGLFLIVARQEKNSVLPMARKFRQKLVPSSKDEVTDQRLQGEYWARAIARLYEIVKGKVGQRQANDFLEDTDVPEGGNFNIGVVYKCSELSDIDFNRMKQTSSNEEIVGAFAVQDFSNVDTTNRFCEGIPEIKNCFDHALRLRILKYIGNVLSESQIKDLDHIESLFRAYFLLYIMGEPDQGITNYLEKLVSNGVLLHRGMQASKEKQYNIVAYTQWLITQSNGSSATMNVIDTAPSFGSNQAAKSWYTASVNEIDPTDQQLVKISELIEQSQGFTDWSEYAVNDSTAIKFYQKVIREVVKRGQFRHLSPSWVVQNYQKFRSVISEELVKFFLEKFSSWDFSEDFSEESEIHRIPNVFITDVCSLDPDLKKEYAGMFESIDEHLKAIDEAGWIKALTENNDNLRILFTRRTTADLILPVGKFKPALLHHAVSMLEGRANDTPYDKGWSNILEALKKNTRQKFAEDLFRKLDKVAVTNHGCEKFINCYYEIAEKMPYLQEPDVAIDQFFTQLLFSKNSKVQQFLSDNSDTLKKCLKKSDITTQESLIELIESHEEKTEDDVVERSAELRELFGLEPRKLAVSDEVVAKESEDPPDAQA